MNSATETDFDDIPFDRTDIETHDDVKELLSWVEETIITENSVGDEGDWLLRFMGLSSHSSFLWDGNRFDVLDDRNFGYNLILQNYEYPPSSK